MSVMCASPGCQPVVSTSTTVNSSASISPAGAPGVMIGAGGRSAVSGAAVAAASRTGTGQGSGPAVGQIGSAARRVPCQVSRMSR